MNYKVNGKVFASEKEAREFSMDLQSYGGIGGWCPTTEPVTHYYLGDLKTEPAEDVFIYSASAYEEIGENGSVHLH